MTLMEFTGQMDRLKQVYSEKAYPEERVKQIWDKIRNRDERVLAHAVALLIADCVQAPMTTKILEAMSVAQRNYQNFRQNALKSNSGPEIDCLFCYDTGINYVREKDNPVVWVRCSCDMGLQNKFRYTFPKWGSPELRDLNLERLDFPVSEWIPPNGEIENRNELAEVWKYKIQLAESYWENFGVVA